MVASTSLAVYQRIQDPISGAKSYGKDIALSRLCNCENEAQGVVLAMECFARGVTALQLAEDYHIIDGKLSMRADAMLAAFNERGGKHRIVSRTADCAEIELTLDGQTISEKLTWAEAQQEPHPFKKDGKTLKTNWATPRARRQMLWARVVSEGVRTLCPGVNRGRYTPEESDDFEEGAVNGNGNGHTVKQKVEVATDVAADAQDAAQGEVIDVQVEEPTSKVAEPTATETAAFIAGQCTADQSNRLKELWGLLNVSVEDRDKQLAKRGAKVARNLTSEQAAELIGKLETVWSNKQRLDGPCTPELANQVKVKLQEAEQQLPGTVAKVTAKVKAAGFQELVELRYGDVKELLDALTGGTMEQFFMVDLWPAKRPEATTKN